MAKRTVHHNTRMFIVEVMYHSGNVRYYVFEVRNEARSFAAEKNKHRTVFSAHVLSAQRGPAVQNRRK